MENALLSLNKKEKERVKQCFNKIIHSQGFKMLSINKIINQKIQ